ncbi:MAG TPA: hypothetical protein ENK06_04040 [Gammaproteobacteria bacterium]|nr:hypothetical protein [Gammaproteobacteria bacterium]
MGKRVVIIGLGEMGGVFARGFLRAGIPVYPVVRTMSIQQAVRDQPSPDLVLLAVAEKDLQVTLAGIPEQWKSRLALLQNELLPADWQQHNIPAPTVISVWFEKKKGQDVKVLIPSPVYGQGAELIKAALAAIDIPVRVVASEAAMEEELLLKNIYILTTNIAGLVCGGSVEYLWNEHNALAREIANEVMDIQSWLVGRPLDREKAMTGFLEAVNGDLNHQCMGRSAPARLARAIELADKAGLAVLKMREIAASLEALK